MLTINNWHGLRFLVLAAMAVTTAPAGAINVVIDYTYDTTNFFGSGNPQGAAAGMQARAVLETAAGYYSSILNDTFSAITIPPPFHSSQYDTTVSWFFDMQINHPSTGADLEIHNRPVPENEYTIFAGARGIAGNTAGIGGIGGLSRGNEITGSDDGRVTAAEGSQLDLINASFFNAIDTRGEPSGFSRWGGSITFDTSARVWHFDHTSPPSGNAADFYTVAIHELAHSLGFGVAPQWHSLVSGSFFEGGNAKLQNAGNAVPLSDSGHWANGTMSVVYGTSVAQEAAMDPDFQAGARKLLTALDAAALKDLGWEVIAPPPPTGIDGDYNDNDIVDAADYVVWRDRLNQPVTIPNDATPGSVTAADYAVWRSNFGRVPGSGSALTLGAVPEPGATVLLGPGAVGVAFARRKRRG
jgi:hypothetical protein